LSTARAQGIFFADGPDRRFGIAVAVSLVAHALILIVFPGLLDHSRSQRLTPAPIVARLAKPLPAAEPPAPEPVRPRQEEAPRPVAKPVPAPSAPPVLSVPTPAASLPSVQAPVAAPRTAEAVQSAPSVAPNPAPVAKAEPGSGQSVPPAAPPAGDSADPATIGQYRISVIAAARRFKRYPRIAMDNNWEGKAEVRLVIGADGNIASISIRTPSGFEVLDQQALEMIRRAKPQAPIPAALRGKGFTIDVPVVFSLKEEG
jgi:protein TonB